MHVVPITDSLRAAETSCEKHHTKIAIGFPGIPESTINCSCVPLLTMYLQFASRSLFLMNVSMYNDMPLKIYTQVFLIKLANESLKFGKHF